VSPAGPPADEIAADEIAADEIAADEIAGGADDVTKQARRLLRWYPRSWRDRYGEEFAQLLISDLQERPHSARRALDVARGGIAARLAAAGLAGFPLPAATAGTAGSPAAEQAQYRRVGVSLGSFGCALGVFLVFGAALWSQVLIAQQWPILLPSAPGELGPGSEILPQASPVVPFLAVLTTAAMLALVVLAVLAALPVLATVAGRVARGQRAGLLRPAAVLAASSVVLFVGGRHFENNWLGTGGQHALIPSGLAAFVWAVTLFVSSWWAHPGMFATLSADQRAWMALSPFILAAAVASAALLVRRARLAPRVAAFEACIGLLACVAMAVFVVGYGVWIGYQAHSAPWLPLRNSVGVTDVAVVMVLALALTAAVGAARTVILGLRRVRS
jgi:hypothetical protein